MKKFIYIFSLILIVFLVGCQNDKKYSIKIENDNIEVYISETKELDFVIEKNGKAVDLDFDIDTNNSKLIKVEDNKITGLIEGELTINIALKSDSKVSKSINVKVVNPLYIITESNFEVNVGHTLQLSAINESSSADVFMWTSGDNNIARVNFNTGLVTALKEGLVTITAKSVRTSLEITQQIIITDVDIESIQINETISRAEIGDKFDLTASIYPVKAHPGIIWSVNDEEIARINQEGELIIMAHGKVIVTAKSTKDSEKQATLEFDVEFDPIKYLEAMHIAEPFKKTVTTFGSSTRTQTVIGSVNKYFNSDLNLIELFVPIDNNKFTGQVATREMLIEAEPMKLVRPGILHPETKYIVYHDTGNNNPGTGAKNHADYMVGTYNRGDRARSWHYSVDDKFIYHHIPDNEVTWQGDSFESYAMGIGIETCVDFGSDLYAVWQRTAKLIAKLLVDNNLTIDSIKQHNYFNGKECPQTLRKNNLYNHAIELVEAEYIALTKLKDFTITFKSLNPNIVDDRGRVINAPLVATKVEYIVQITNNYGYNELITLTSTIPAK